MRNINRKPLMAGGLWFPELKTLFALPDKRHIRVSMFTDANREEFSRFALCFAPLAGVVTINEVNKEGSTSRALVSVRELEGELLADYMEEELFNENDLIRFANVLKAMIA